MPQVRYARSGDVYVAYQVLGTGPVDLVLVGGFLTHLGVLWEEPRYRRFVERLASFSRVLLFDKRGMGLSDRVQVGTLEERMDDVRAVMDAAGSERAALMGVSEGGPLSLLFAATYPERTTALILCGAEVKEETTDEWPWGEARRGELEKYLAALPDRWGDGLSMQHMMPSVMGEELERLNAWSVRLQSESASPGAAIAFIAMSFEIDVRDVLPAVSVPTLVLHAIEDHVCHVEQGRYLAAHVDGARYVELPGGDHLPWGEHADRIVGETQEFLTGAREAPEPDRVLATVLFTDIVGSTERLAEVGDRRYAELLEAHHQAVRHELGRFRGRELDTAGDGFLASFDGPARAIRCAEAIVGAVGAIGLQVRAGVHTGECEVVGEKLGGLAVHIGARVAGEAGPGEVLVSGTVRDLVAGSGLAFADRGTVALKGVPGEWRLYAVTPG